MAVSARPEKILHLQTTHTPKFLGLQQQMGLWKESNFGKGIIIGVLDSGITPDHPSPSKWKGRCKLNVSACNNKLIGARSFNIAAKAMKGDKAETPIDDEGHGTHTASTAAGAFVVNAEALGNAKGTAAGMAPNAHLASYKVCLGEDCPESDILAGLDAAAEDGVDVISISLGGSKPESETVPLYDDDKIAVGAFAAIQKGIFVSCAAGNSYPFNSSLDNEARWILTVGASTIDRSIAATAKLGNGQEFDGESVFQPPSFPPTLLPLVHAGKNGQQESSFCANGPGMTVMSEARLFCVREEGI